MKLIIVLITLIVVYESYLVGQLREQIDAYVFASHITAAAFKEQRKMLKICEARGLEEYRQKSREELARKLNELEPGNE